LLPVYQERDGFSVEPGDYTVLFGAQAIADILMMAGWTGFMGRSWEEKMGWTSNRQPGDMIFGENVTIVDDPGDPHTYRFGFDYQGRRRRLFPIVQAGALKQLMYDTSTAGKYGKSPTGHDIYSPSIVMETGDGPSDPLEAVKGMGRVLYIPALHYMHVPNRSEGIFTGSSRFSAVLVEDGHVVQPMFSTRVTDTFESVFGSVRVMSSVPVSVNQSNTYGRRSPVALSVPQYVVAEGVKITDCADSF
jgi:predicted Zn-dependent protease